MKWFRAIVVSRVVFTLAFLEIVWMVCLLELLGYSRHSEGNNHRIPEQAGNGEVSHTAWFIACVIQFPTRYQIARFCAGDRCSFQAALNKHLFNMKFLLTSREALEHLDIHVEEKRYDSAGNGKAN